MSYQLTKKGIRAGRKRFRKMRDINRTVWRLARKSKSYQEGDVAMREQGLTRAQALECG